MSAPREMTTADPPRSAWGKLLAWLQAVDETLSMTSDDIRDRRLAWLETELGQVKQTVAELGRSSRIAP